MTAMIEPADQQPEAARQGDDQTPYSRRRLLAGVLGRSWLWFIGGCLAVTLVPVIFGWRPYVIQSGSMQPRIKVGDIVIASPDHDPQRLLGRVTVFQDPDFPAKVKTHRVVRIAKDGRLVTKGDANPTVDSQPVKVEKVRGLGRLLVRYAGLPVIWAHTGKWLYLLFFGLSLYLAALFVARDQEGEDVAPEDPPTDPTPDLPETEKTGAVPRPREARPTHVLGVERRAMRRAARRLLWRSAALLGLSLILALPTARAAFAAITRSTANSWSAGTWADYTNQIKALNPFLYYKLDDAGGSAVDSSGHGYDGAYSGSIGTGGVGALPTNTPNYGVDLKSNVSCIYSSPSSGVAASGPTTYSEVVWFKAASGYKQGGKLVGLESAQSGQTSNSGQFDRHIYMDANGQVSFGVRVGSSATIKTITGASNYADGAWHMAVATMGSGGMRLYVDGVLRVSDPNTQSQTFTTTGYWRFGCGNLTGWVQGGQSSQTFQGQLDELAIFTTQLSATDIGSLYSMR